MPAPAAISDALAMFQSDVLDIIVSRERAKLIHRLRNIRSSGDEVEITVRHILQRRLSPTVHVTHGHVVDVFMRASNQLDLIICDPRYFPVFNRLRDGSEQILYDAVYAVGEIKSSYALGSIEEFCDKLRRIKDELSREPSLPVDKLPFKLGKGLEFNTDDPEPLKNPLFSFMVYVSSSSLNLDELRNYYASEQPKYLPNVICLLDRGLILNASVYKQKDDFVLRGLTLVPEFTTYYTPLAKQQHGPDFDYRWILFRPGKTDKIGGASLMVLHSLLISFMRVYFLKPTNVSDKLLSSLNYHDSIVF